MATQVSDPVHLDRLAPPLVRRMGWYPDPSKTADLRWWNGNEWSSHTQAHDPASRDALTTWGIILGLLLPIAGAAIGVVLLARNRVGPGLACFGAAVLGVVIWLAITGP